MAPVGEIIQQPHQQPHAEYSLLSFFNVGSVKVWSYINRKAIIIVDMVLFIWMVLSLKPSIHKDVLKIQSNTYYIVFCKFK